MSTWGIVLLAAVAAAPAAAQQKPAPQPKPQQPGDAAPFKLLGAPSSQLGAGPVSFPLVAVGKVDDAPPAAVVSVAQDGVADPGLREAFEVKVERSGHELWSLVLQPKSVTEKPATYAVRVALFDAAGKVAQDLALQLTRAAATLQLPSTLTAVRVLTFHGPDEDECGDFVVRETSGKASPELVASHPEPARLGDATATTQLLLENVPKRLPAGQAATIACRISGSAAPGVTKGTIRLDAVQLGAPVTLPYELRTRRTRLLVPIILFLGVAAGWLLRVGLQEWRARSQAQLDLLEAERRLVEADREHQDEAFHTAIDPQIELLEAEGSKVPFDVTSAKKAVETAQTVLTSALAALATARQEVHGHFAVFVHAVSAASALPPGIAAALDAASKRVDEVRELLARDAVSQAARALDAARSGAFDAVRAAVLGWKADVVPALDHVSPGEAPASVSQELEQPAKAVRDALTSVEGTPAPKLDELVGAIEAVQRSDDALVQAAWAEYRRAFATLGRAYPDAADAERLLAPVRDAFNAAKAETLADLPARLTAFGRVNAAFQRAAEEMVKQLLGDLTRAPAVTTALKARQYPEAVEAASMQRSEHEEEVRKLLERAVTNFAARPPAPEASHAPAAPGDGGASKLEEPPSPARRRALAVVGFVGRHDRPLRLPHIAARAARERIIASGLQSLGILALTVAFGTFTYAEDFAGKWSELSALFTWGFTANLGLEGLIAAAEKVKKG